MVKKRKIMNKKASRKLNTAKGVKIYKVDNYNKNKEARARKEKGIQTFLIVIIVILAVAAIFSAIQTFFPDLFGRFTLQGELAAKVNGQTITMNQLNTEYDRLPLQYKYFVTKEDFLNQLIDEELMLQEAGRQGIIASEEEIDARIQSFMQDNNVTDDQLNQVLKEKQLTPAELRKLISNQLIIDKLLESMVKSKINITSEMAVQYYNDNPETFRIPELVTARHILIGVDNRTEEQAQERADTVFELVKNDTTRFCSYVWLYTDDAGSTETCGEYTFPRGQMVEEFENKAFEQGVDEISLVQTSFGFHIIQTVNKTPEQLMPFRDVEGQINIILKTQQEKAVFSDFIVGLRNQADIVNYVEKMAQEEAEQVPEEAEEAEEAGVEGGEEIPIVIEEPEEETEEAEEVEELEEELTDEQEELEEEVDEVIEEIVEEEPVEEEMVEEEPVEEPVEEEVVEEEVPMEDLTFTQCLTAKGAVLYGAYWDSSTKKQKDVFGADIADIAYVECGVEGDYRAQTQECADADILAYPTWAIDGTKYMGIMSLDQLATLTECEK